MKCYKLFGLILWAGLGVVATSNATVPLPISMNSSSMCSYEVTTIHNGKDVSTMPGIVCPPFFTINGSSKNGSGHNYTGHGGSLVPLVTIISTSTEVSTIQPSAVVETVIETSTISKWHTATETDGGTNTTISYVEIVSYSILSMYTTTFLAPPTPITYTVEHPITLTATANGTYQRAIGSSSRPLSPSQTRHAVNASSSPSHGAGGNVTSTGMFGFNNTSLPTTLVYTVSSASLSDVPVWTDTLGAGNGNGNGNGTTLTPISTFRNTTASGIVVTLTTTVKANGTGTVSPGEVFTTDASSAGVANATYYKPMPSLASTNSSGGSAGGAGSAAAAATSTPTTKAQSKSCSTNRCVEYVMAGIAGLIIFIV